MRRLRKGAVAVAVRTGLLMYLDDHILEEVAMALGAVQADTSEPRRRRANRYAVGGSVLIKPYGVVNSTRREVQLVDISAVGICILDRLMTSAGNQFVVYLPRIGGDTIDVICTVRQARLATNGAFRVGAEFTGEADVTTRLVRGINGVMASGVGTPTLTKSEKGVNIPAQIRLANAGSNRTFHSAEIREASGVGVSLVTGRALAAGEEFILEFSMGKRKAYAWRCVVTHVRVLDTGQFRVNAKIVSMAEPGRSQKTRGLIQWFQSLFGL